MTPKSDLHRGPVFVVPKTSLFERFAEKGRDKLFLDAIERGSRLVEHVLPSHEQDQVAVHRVVEVLEGMGLDVEIRPHATKREAARAGLVVTVGGDGTLLDASHWLTRRPVLGVNSNPDRSVGYFCAATVDDVEEKLTRILRAEVDPIPVGRMELRVNGRRLPHQALNDVLFAHRCPAAISEYVLRIAGAEEWQRSSGVWFSTAAGSTGAIRAAGGLIQPVRARALQYLVREPLRSDDRPYRFVQGFADDGIELRSRSFDAAVFIDGQRLHKRMGFGDLLQLRHSDQPLRLYLF